MSDDDRGERTMTERDHPQTRKAEPDARGSSAWRDDVEPPESDDEPGDKGDPGGDPGADTGGGRG